MEYVSILFYFITQYTTPVFLLIVSNKEHMRWKSQFDWVILVFLPQSSILQIKMIARKEMESISPYSSDVILNMIHRIVHHK